MQNKYLLLGLVSLVVLAIAVGSQSARVDMQGRVRQVPSFLINPQSLPQVSTAHTTPTSQQSTSSQSSPATSVGVGSTSTVADCQSDTLQAFSVAVDGSTPYTERAYEKTFNGIFDDGSAMGEIIKQGIKNSWPNVNEVSSVSIEGDHPNYQENGERGSVRIETVFTDSKFKQKSTVVAKDEGLPAYVRVKLNDGTYFVARIFMSNPELGFTVTVPLRGSFDSLSYPNAGIENSGVRVDFTKFTTATTVESVKRITPEGVELSDPILASIVKNIIESNPINFSSSTASINNIVNSGAMKNLSGSQNYFPSSMGDHMQLIARISHSFTMKKTLADGMNSTYKPVMVYKQGDNVKIHACSSSSASNFSAGTLNFKYVRDGVVYNTGTTESSNDYNGWGY